jgi:serine/threonine-protein kinase
MLRRLALGAALALALAAAGLTAFRLASPPPEVATVVVAEPPHSVDPVPPPDTAPAVVERVAPRPPAQPRRPPTVVAVGHLFVGATPWGELYIDGRLVGHTPMAALPIAAGWHQVRIVRDGFAPFEQRVQVAPGGDVRLTGIVLHAP